MNPKESMPFDQYQRYAAISLLIEFHRAGDPEKTFRVLELGSNEHKDLSMFLGNDNIVYTDIVLTEKMKDDPAFMQVDGSCMPFGDNEFDFVVSADVLEHVPEEKRLNFISEACRVSKTGTIICFPNNEECVRGAEARVNSYYKALNGKDFIWLKEHIENGLPDRADIDKFLKDKGYCFFDFCHGRINIWEKMWYCIFNSVKAPLLLDYHDKITNYYNEEIFPFDIGEKCYRVFYVISENDVTDWKRYAKTFWKKGNDSVFGHLNTLLEAHSDIHRMYLNNKINEKNQGGIYFNCNGFSEENTVKFTLSCGSFATGKFRIPAGCSEIRFDPVEGYSCIVSELVAGSSNGILTLQDSNSSKVIDGRYFFDTPDPQFYFPVPAGTVWAEISCNVVVLESIFEQKLIGDMEKERENSIAELRAEIEERTARLNEEKAELEGAIEDRDREINRLEEEGKEKDGKISELNKEKENIATELEHYKEHYNAAIGQTDRFTAELAQWQGAYNSISESRFWRITAPARKVSDGVKKVLKSNRVTYLFCKGVISLKRNGVKVTWEKVKSMLSVKYRMKSYKNSYTITDKEREREESTKFDRDIKISILVPLYNTPQKFLEEMIGSVIGQTYSNWEICLADGSDGKHKYVGELVKKLAKGDKRIKYTKLKENLGISENTNACIDISTGDYIALFDHDDILHPSALFEVMKAICEKGADFVYTDEATFESPNLNKIITAHFKPDFAPDNLRANNYICHLSVFSRELMEKSGKFRKEYDGSQDHDIILRLTANAKKIVHIPKILYYWRSHPMSVAMDIGSKSYAVDAGKNAVRNSILESGYDV
ncbi:MAG: glycosyltransferase, partial [Ruminococcus sp.]|nr:glycosyltransferase [Ruminococcus sp.]